MSIRSQLITTVSIQTQTVAKTATGGTSLVWSTTQANVPAAVMDASDDVREFYARLGQRVTNRVYFDADYGLTVKERIVFNGVAYDVRGVTNAGNNRDRLWQVDCEAKALGS